MMTSLLDLKNPIGALSDAQLFARSLTDASAFGEIVERHVNPVFRFVAARIGSQRAEDVVAETFATAFDRRARFDKGADSARPWLYGIAVNRLLKHRDMEQRWLQRAALEPISALEPEGQLADARMDAARLAPAMARALLELSPGERDVLLLFALEELTHQQIADLLGIRRGSAKARLSRGCARLREHLSMDLGGPT